MSLLSSIRKPAIILIILVSGILVALAANAPTTGLAGFGDGRLVYGEGTINTPRTRTYTPGPPGSWSSEGSLPLADDRIQWSVVESNFARDEKIIGVLSDNSGAGSRLDIQRESTATITSDFTITTADTTAARRRTFDIAYEQESGEGLVAYSQAANAVYYRTYNGTSWSSESSFTPGRTGADVQWIELVQNPKTDEILLIWADSAGDISAKAWNGSSWGAEPSAALTTNMAYITTPGDQKSFDAAWEETSDEFLIVWGENAAPSEYITGSATSWGTLNADISASWSREGTIMSAAAEPGGNGIVVAGHAADGNESLGQAVWTGSSWTSVVNNVNIGGNMYNPGAADGALATIDTAWLKTGGNVRAMVFFARQATTAIRYNYWNGGNWTNNLNFTPSPTLAQQTNILLRSRPDDTGELMAFISDVNLDLHAKELVLNGTSLSWSNTEGGTVLENSLSAVSNYRTQNFGFDFYRYIGPPVTTLGDGSSPADKLVDDGSFNNAASAFTLETNIGTDTLSRLEVTGANTSNIVPNGVKLWLDNGSIGNEWDSTDTSITGGVASFSGDKAVFSGLNIPVLKMPRQYLVTLDITQTPTAYDELTTTVTSATVAVNPLVLNDNQDAVLTIDLAPPQAVTNFNAADNEFLQSTLTWNNPNPGELDLAEVVVMRKTGSYPTSHTDGTQVYQDLAPVGGALISHVDTGLTTRGEYYYAVFSRDLGGSWNDTVDALAPNINADIGVPGSGGGRLTYGEGVNIAPRSRTYNKGAPGTWSTEGVLRNSDDRIQWTVVESAPTRPEAMLGVLSDSSTVGSRLDIQRDATGTLTDEFSIGTANTNWARRRTFDIGYEQNSGDAMVVYSKVADAVYYRTYNGTSWSAEQNFNPVRTNGSVQWIEVVPRPFSDQILVVWADGAGDVSASVWSGTAWWAEPAAALTTTLANNNSNGDMKAFDAAWEESGGDFVIVWGEEGARPEFTTGTAVTTTTWGPANTDISGTWTREGTIMSIAAEPGGDRMVVAGHDTNQRDLSQAAWNGQAWRDVVNDLNITMESLQGNESAQATVDTVWLKGGSQARGIVAFGLDNASSIRYNSWNVGWTNNQVFDPSPAIAQQTNILFRRDPANAGEGLAIFSDLNLDLHAKKISFDGFNISWANADGGSVLETDLSAAGTYRTQNFDFDFERYRRTVVGDGVSPADKTVGRSYTNQAVNAFRLTTSGGVDVVKELKVSGTNTSNLPANGVKLWKDNGGTLNEWDSSDTSVPAGVSSFSSGIAVFSGLNIIADTTETQYLVTYDIKAGPIHGRTLTGYVTSATANNAIVNNDSADAVLTIDAEAPPTVADFNAADDENRQSTLSWTNPDPSANDLDEVIVVRRSGSYPASHTDGTQIYQDTSPVEGSSANYTDTGLSLGTTYYYAVFSRDDLGNWNDTVDSFLPGLNVDTGRPSVHITLGDGTSPAGATVGPSYINQAVDVFTIETASSTDSISQIVVTGTNTGNVAASGVRLWLDNGGSPNQWDAGDTSVATTSFASPTATFSGLDLEASVTPVRYLITYDISASPTHAQTLRGYVSSAVASRVTNLDSYDATITIDAEPPPTATDFNASDGAALQSTITWTNPDPADGDLDEVVVMRKTGSYPSNHTDGTQVYQDSSPVAGAPVNYVDAGLSAGVDYYYAVFSRDAFGNWNDLVDETAPNVSADIGNPAPTSNVTVYPTSVAPASVYQGQTMVPMARFYLLVDTQTAPWTNIRVDLGGTGATAADVAAVKIYRSADTGFDPGSDTLIGSGAFNASNYAQINIADQTIRSTTSVYYFVVFDIAALADSAHALTAGFGASGPTYFTIVSPDAIGGGNLPFYSAPAMEIEPISTVLTSIDMAPATLRQGYEDDFLRFSAVTDSETVTIENLTLNRLGSLEENHVESVAIWRSEDQTFDGSARDTQIASGPFTGDSVTFTDLNEAVGPSVSYYYFATVKLTETAAQGANIGLRLPADGFTVSAGTATNAQTDSSLATVLKVAGLRVYHWNNGPRAAPKPQPGWTRTIGTQKLQIVSDSDSTTMTAIRVTRAGTMADSGAIVKIYQSDDGSFDVSNDTEIGVGAFSVGSSDITLTPQAITSVTASYYFVALEINDTVSIGNTIGTVLANEGVITVGTLARVEKFSNLRSYIMTMVGEPHGSPNNPGAFTNTSLCGTCHMVHLAPRPKRILQKLFTKEPEVVNNNPASVYIELCFSCHDGSGSSINIKQHFDAPEVNAGHRIDYTGDATKARDYGYPAGGITYNKGTQLPCLICHDVHHSRNGNYKMLSDELYEYASSSAQNTDTAAWDPDPGLWSSNETSYEVQRKRCEVCHRSHNGTPHSSDTTQNGTGGFADNKSVIVGIDMARPGSHAKPPRDTRVCYGADGCHYNPHNPGTGESRANTGCRNCHLWFDDMNKGTASYHHYLNNADVTALASSGSKYPTKNLFNAADSNAQERRCLMCHGDHDLFSPAINPEAKRGSNLRLDVTQIPASPADVTNTDFVPAIANGGICLSCHKNSQTKSTTRSADGTFKTLVIEKDKFAVSEHNFTTTATFRSDGSVYRPNCEKCHNTTNSTKAQSSFQSSALKFELHDHPYRRLLAILGIASPSDPLEESFCWQCHTGGTAGYDYYGAKMMSLAARNIESQFSKPYRHPIDMAVITKHRPVEGESSSSAWNTAADRHVECMDCHNPHGVKAGNAVEGSSAIGGPNIGIWGVKPTWTTIYKTGTATFADATTTVTGTGTSWLANLAEGWFIKNDWDMAGTWYEIDSVDSDTRLTLKKEYDSAFSSPDNVSRLSGVRYTSQGVSFERTANVDNQYELCMKCHSRWAYAETPPKDPSGMANGAVIDETDLSLDYNPNQMAIHPVTALGKNQPISPTGDTTSYSAWNTSWPRFTAGTVTITTDTPATATFTSNTPSPVIPGWYIKYGSSAAPTTGQQKNWFQVTKVTSSTSFEVTPTPTAAKPAAAFSLTAGLGNAFIPPFGPWARLVCTNCHSGDSWSEPKGPHGSSQKWILRNTTTTLSFLYYNGSSVVTVTPNNMNVNSTSNIATNQILCYNCHRRDNYGDVGQSGNDAPQNLGRVRHDVTQNENTYRADLVNKWGIVCMNCHGGDSLGGIHGSSRGLGRGGSNNMGERFLNGATWNGVNRATTGSQVQCFTKSVTNDAVTNCDGDGGHTPSGRSANYNWP